MVYNCFIRCHVCGSITRVRLQVGWQEEHPIVVACRKCGISLNGKVKIGQDMPGLEFSFENAEILREDESADYVVECSGEFPTKKLCFVILQSWLMKVSFMMEVVFVVFLCR